MFAVKGIATDLERVGDLARNIAKSALRLAERSPVARPAQLDLLTDDSRRQLRNALDCFTSLDVERAQNVLDSDERIDALQDVIVEHALREIGQHPSDASQWVDLIMIAKNLERVADHATNIAEDVILIAEARNVKHADKLAAGQ